MVEQTKSRKCHNKSALVAALDNKVVTDRSAGLRNVGNAAHCRTVDVIGEGEECIRADCNALDGCKVRLLLFNTEVLGSFLEVLLPVALGTYVLLVVVNITVDNVVSVWTLDIVSEGKVKYLVVLTEEPCVCLCACKACAVDSRLLIGCAVRMIRVSSAMVCLW